MGKTTTLLNFFSFMLLVGSLFFLMAFQSSEITIKEDSIINVVCPKTSSGSISVSVSGGTGSLSYSWTGPGDYSSTSQDINGLPEGTYRLTVTDQTTPTPLTATAEFIITQKDPEKPTLTAPADKEISADTGKCTASNVSIGSPQMDDNCGVSSIQNDAPAVFPLGETTVTWTVRDASGNTETDTQIIIVIDSEKPTITAPADVEVSADSGSCEAIGVSLGSATTGDNCTVKNVANDAPSSFSVGNTTVIWTVTDEAGNTQTDTQTVTVIDAESPTITAPADVEVSADSGSCEATGVSLGSATTNDNCAVENVKNDATSSFPLGNTTVTWTVTDEAGNIQTDTQTVTVIDSEKPTITAPADVEVAANSGSCEANGVSLGSAITDDNCAVENVKNNAPSSFPLGNTTVTWTVTDEAGNIQTDTQVVTVIDSEKPTITAPADVEVSADSGSCNATGVNLGSAITGDNCVVENVKNDAPSSFPLGNTTVIWTVTDEAGNTQTDTQNVTVIDSEKPTITAPADVEVSADSGSCEATGVSLGSATSDDNCAVENVTNNILSSFPLGNTTVIWTVTDEAGNTQTDTQIVTVIDSEKPTITAPADVEVSANSGSCNATGVNLGSATINDNCAVENVTNDAPPSFPLGNTTVTWTVTDQAGNTQTDTQIVFVKDDELPVITAGADMSVNNDPGTCSASVNITAATASDNCATDAPKGTRSDGKALTEKYPVGTTTITWNVTDDGGNKAEPVEQLITVTDNESPEVPVLEDILWGCEYTFSVPTTTDNCAGTIEGTTTDPLTYSSPGEYTVNWIFDDGKENTISVPQKLTIDPVKGSAEITDVLCNGYSTGEVTITGSGGVGPYTYTWSSLGTGAIKNELSAGSYSVVVTDANGCKSNPLEVIITEPDSFLEITKLSFTSGCYEQNNATATVEAIGGTGNYSYLWSDGQTGPTANNLIPGEYSVTVTDENGCEATKSVNVSSPEELIIPAVSTTQTTSFGTATGTATANVSGGTGPFTFEWSNGATGQITRNLAAGDYSVTVTDAYNCSYTKDFTIVDPLESAILPTSMCLSEEGGIRTSTFETEFVRGGTAPYSYSWTFGTDASLPDNTEGAGVHVVEYSSTGNKVITLTVTDVNGLTFEETFHHYVGECFEACGETQNLDFDLETFYVGKEDQTPLSGSECSTYTGRKYIYLKVAKNSNAYNPNVEFIYTITDLNNGGNVVDVQEITGCIDVGGTGKDEGKIPPIFRVGEIANWSCGYSIRIENFYMSWTNNSNKKCGDVRRMMCVSTNENDEIHFPLYASATSNNLLCYGDTSGVITATAAGGIGIREFRLNKDGAVETDWQTEKVFRELSAGTYTVTVRDEELDTYTTQELVISEPQDPLTVAQPMIKTSVTCHGGSDGTATVEVTGGTPFSTGEPYIYVWSDSQTAQTATGLEAGDYSVTIIDANGCEVTEYVTIEQPELSQSHAGTDQTLACGVMTTTIGQEIPEEEEGSWEVVNGPSGWTLDDPDSPTTTFTGKIGTYTLRWTESCGSTDDVKITVKDCSTIDFDGENDHIEFGDNYDLSGAFSIEAWVKLKSTSGVKTVLSKRDLSNLSSNGYDLIVENSVPKFRWNGNTITSAYPIGTDRWYHLAFTSGSSGAALYIDGIEVATGAQASPSSNEHPFIIGALFDSASALSPRNYFHGWIEEVRIWNTGISEEQIRFMMNQKLQENNGFVRGKEIPLNVPGSLEWDDLTGYYHLETVQSGFATGETATSAKGKLRNITTIQEHSAPLPYVSKKEGNWNDMGTASTPWLYGTGIWDAPNSRGVLQDSLINWNIVKVSNDIHSGSRDITVLGLISERETLYISKSGDPADEYDPGQSLRITDYLELNGTIDLIGESQLLQDEKSILAESSSGNIERDQQGTASSYNYNYWSSPVIPRGNPNNSGYTIKEVLRDGTDPSSPIALRFDRTYHFADWKYSGAKRISSYWLFKYSNNASNTYSEWQYVGETGSILSGEGFSMKGTMGTAEISDRQNYTFTGKPNNGRIELTLDAGNDYLIGNPYPSAIDGEKFILDNLSASGGNNSQNIFNGTLYFWDHFSGKTHYVQEYVGGYATLNLSGGTVAVATDTRINATGEKADENSIPQQFIPVGQAFLISTQSNPQTPHSISGGQIIFRNSQRVFETDDQRDDKSIFKSHDGSTNRSKTGDKRQKIYLHFHSPQGYLRQLLVTNDMRSTSSFDLGFDAPLIENNKEDMYWMIDSIKTVIQGVPDFDKKRVLPLGVKIKEEGDFSISIDTTFNLPDDFKIFVKDSLTETIHDLTKSEYKISGPAGATNDRFAIVFQEEEIPVEEEEPIEEIISGKFDLFYSEKEKAIIIINPELRNLGQGILYNILGQKIHEYPDIPEQPLTSLPVKQTPPGVYIIKIDLKEGSTSVKFVKE